MSKSLDKKIDDLMQLGHQIIAGATELRKGPAKNGTPRKGLSEEQLARIISKRTKTALKKQL